MGTMWSSIAFKSSVWRCTELLDVGSECVLKVPTYVAGRNRSFEAVKYHSRP